MSYNLAIRNCLKKVQSTSVTSIIQSELDYAIVGSSSECANLAEIASSYGAHKGTNILANVVIVATIN